MMILSSHLLTKHKDRWDTGAAASIYPVDCAGGRGVYTAMISASQKSFGNIQSMIGFEIQ
jgi:hypothetical protein